MVMDVSPPDDPCTPGKGNSPPARNEAFCPLSVVIAGSARICAIFLSCRSCSVNPIFRPKRKKSRLRGLLLVRVAGEVQLPGVKVWVDGNCPVVTLLVFFPAVNKLTPNWSTFE